jgi:hypothetical protein
MQIGQFFYWFLDPEWWISATQGIAGALIGFTGLYLVFRFTRAHELDLQEQAHKENQERIEDDRTVERVGSIIQACLNMEPSRLDRELTDFNNLIRLLTLFYAHEIRRHPNIAGWAMEQAMTISLGVRIRDLQVPFIYSTSMVGYFTAWLKMGLTDDAGDAFNLEEITSAWRSIEESVDPSLAVTWDDLRSTDAKVQEEAKRRLDLWKM